MIKILLSLRVYLLMLWLGRDLYFDEMEFKKSFEGGRK